MKLYEWIAIGLIISVFFFLAIVPVTGLFYHFWDNRKNGKPLADYDG